MENLQTILEAVSAGYITPETARQKIQETGYQSVAEFAKIDHQRQERTGFPEVIWGQDKTSEQIARIIEAMSQHQSVIMATRVETQVYEEVKLKIPHLRYYPTARICALGKPNPQKISGKITILTAGTSDLPVAEEAAITGELMGFPVERLWDVGVSGVHRLLNNRHILDEADVLIVVAGMEGALPSVVGGLAHCPVIGVPTSIGYGASFGGLSALLAMLNSCAAGLGVVNIDNGFGAAILAGQILRTAAKIAAQSK
ncbi:MAG: nickel pincer cofactor biosynthesis protein LarB [Cyanobacteria bacterium SBLK]|nr:nickel pincer cofactor biosynthesis protein LarB [Cyanobacteria bacterium SBLK]